MSNFPSLQFRKPDYTSLSDEAHAGWIRLQAESRQTILTETPVLEAGLPGSAMVASSRAAAIAKGRPDPMLTATVANKEFPAFTLPDDWDVVVQDGGAILRTGVVMRLMRARAGERVIPERATFAPPPGRRVDPHGQPGVLRRARDSGAGPMARSRTPEAWRAAQRNPTGGRLVRADPPRHCGVRSFPDLHSGARSNDVVYGFPDFEQRGVKAAPHNHGPVVSPDDWGPQATEAELRPVGEALAALVPGAAGPIIDRDV